jgi:hypothetical protein
MQIPVSRPDMESAFHPAGLSRACPRIRGGSAAGFALDERGGSSTHLKAGPDGRCRRSTSGCVSGGQKRQPAGVPAGGLCQVEPIGLEPTTSCMPCKRSPN